MTETSRAPSRGDNLENTMQVETYVPRVYPSDDGSKIVFELPSKIAQAFREHGGAPPLVSVYRPGSTRAFYQLLKSAHTSTEQRAESPWMTPSEYAKHQGVSRSTIYEWLKKPKFPRRRGCRGGKSIPVKEADEFLKLGGLTRGTKR